MVSHNTIILIKYIPHDELNYHSNIIGDSLDQTVSNNESTSDIIIGSGF